MITSELVIKFGESAGLPLNDYQRNMIRAFYDNPVAAGRLVGKHFDDPSKCHASRDKSAGQDVLTGVPRSSRGIAAAQGV